MWLLRCFDSAPAFEILAVLNSAHQEKDRQKPHALPAANARVVFNKLQALQDPAML